MKRSTTVIRFLCAGLLLALFCGVSGRVEAASPGAQAGLVVTKSTGLNVREKPFTNARIRSLLAKGSYVTLIRQEGDWWYVEYDKDRYGYCHGDYIQILPESYSASVQTAYSPLNVRAGAGMAYEIEETVAKGSTIVVLSQVGNWSYVLYHGTELGYVSTRFIQKNGSQRYAPISLATKDYKQYDSRWAYTPLGNSGKNIREAGCLTSALAIVESFRTGTTVTPATMAKQSSYTKDGSLYWPVRYQFYMDEPLSKIYDLLEEGKPVIFGCRNQYGGQHWVVVSAYAGGEYLQAKDFTIRDPGSGSRKTLADLLEDYPNFYKLAYFSWW